MPDNIFGTTATTSTLALNSSYGSTIDTAGDQDWFRISLNAGTVYTFRQDKAGGSTLDSYLRLMNASGGQVAYDDDSGGNGNSLLTYTPTSSGSYYVAAGSFNGQSTGAYSLSATAAGGSTPAPTPVPSGDIPGSVATATSLALNSSYGSTIDTAGDQDWFRISLNAGTVYTFRQDKAGGSTLDSYLRLMNASGGQVAYDDDSGGNGNSLLTYTPTSSGSYYVAAGSFNGQSTGAYSLSAMVSAPADTAAPTLTNRSPLDEATNVTASSNIVLTFNEAVRAGTGNIIITNLTAGGSRNISVTDTSQVSFSGSTMTINPSSDLSAGSRFEVTLGSSVVKDIAGNNYGGLSTGSLNFNTAAATPTDTILGSIATTSTMALNSTYGSTIDTAGDQDWFRISLNAGTAYTFRQDKAGGSSLDSYLRVMNASGAQVAYDDDSGGNGNSLITYTPTSSGTYYVAASSYNGQSTGAYSLSATASAGTSPAASEEFWLFWCTRDLNMPGGGLVGNHHFLLVVGDTGAITNEVSLGSNLVGFTMGATSVNGRLTAYGSDFMESHNETLSEAAIKDIEAVREHVTGRTIGSSNEDLDFKLINTQDGNLISSLINARNNYINSNVYIDYELDAFTFANWVPGVSGGANGNCASWVNTILDVVGLPLTDGFGDMRGTDVGHDHLIFSGAFI